MRESQARGGFDYIRRAYRHASAHLVICDYGWILAFFNAQIGFPALIGSVAVFLIQALRRGFRSAISTVD
jgi:hypothetical protein